MLKHSFICALIVVALAAFVFPIGSVDAQDDTSTQDSSGTSPGVIAVLGEYDIFDPIDHAEVIRAYNFDCNGTLEETSGIYWLTTSNPFKFRKRFTGQWYFENLPRYDFADDLVPVKMVLLAYTQHPSRGGRPTSADVNVAVTNPQNDEVFEIKGVKVGFTREGVPRPTYVYIPLRYVSDDGRLIIEVSGIGQIGLHASRLGILVGS